MALYRVRETGEVKNQGQVRALHPNTSIPKKWDTDVCDSLGIDELGNVDYDLPAIGTFQILAMDGARQNEDGLWMPNYVLAEMFAGDDEKTKAEREAEHAAELNETLSVINRSKRTDMLNETDFYALSDMTMSDEMAAFRHALRNLPSHANWPNLEDSDWPTKPS